MTRSGNLRSGPPSENLRNVLSALLYEASAQSNDYMLVLATNRPEDLDPAVLDRIDEVVHFDIPDTEVRTFDSDSCVGPYIGGNGWAGV